MTQSQLHATETPVPVFPSFLSDKELATLLGTTIEWVRAHAEEIPGFTRLGSYYRFRQIAVERWLGGSSRLLACEEVALLMKIPKSWVYANADSIPGVVRLGRYIRFRPAVVRAFLSGSEVVQ